MVLNLCVLSLFCCGLFFLIKDLGLIVQPSSISTLHIPAAYLTDFSRVSVADARMIKCLTDDILSE